MNDPLLPIADHGEVRSYLRTMVKQRRKPMTLTVVLYVVGATAGLAGPWLLGGLVQSVSHGSSEAHIDRVALLLLAFVLLQALLMSAATVQGGVVSQSILAQIREEFIERIVQLPLSQVERVGTGDLVSRASRDVDSLARTAQYALPALWASAFVAGITVVGMIAASPLLALVIIVGLPPLYAGTRWYVKRSGPAYLRFNRAAATITEELSASFQGAGATETYQLQERRIRACDAAVDETYRADVATLRLRTYFLPITDAALRLPMIAALVAGGVFYARGWSSLGAVTAIILYTQQLVVPVTTAREWLTTVQASMASLSRLVGVIDAPVEEQQPRRRLSDRNLVVRDVGFGYGSDSDVLSDVNVTINEGERITIVGPSGAGKSTLARLLAGSYSPSAGSVTLGGIPLRRISEEQLREEIALVTQDQFVFTATVSQNLAIAARRDHIPTEQELLEALQIVGAVSWVESLPNGMNTTIGSGGTHLDPAQVQQLSLARLIVRDPKVLILDEATSSLDPHSARGVEHALGVVLQHRTVIDIAHRLHSAADADHIAVMESGRIVEYGPHERLLAKDGTYASLWKRWRGAAPA